MRVLVTDGNERVALAVARSLVRAGHEVSVAAPTRVSLAGASRAVRPCLVATDPLTDSARYATAVGRIASERGVQVLLPLTDASVEALLEHVAALPRGVVLPFPDLATYRAASDKARILTLAQECGFGVPETRVIATPGDARALPDPGFFPAFVKPHRSVVSTGGIRRKLTVTPVVDAAACRRALDALPPAAYPVLLQRRLDGVGEGFFALRWRGRTVAMFAHRRLREKPPAGGVSVYRESIPLDERLAGPGLRLLDALDWEGVAMVECKREAGTDRQVVMEVNGRFWGSLQLAIDAGIDFPTLLVRCVAGEAVPQFRDYRIGVRCRWFWGDVDHLYLRLRHGGARLQALRAFLRRSHRDRNEIWRWTDPLPFVVETLQWLRLLDTDPHSAALRATRVGSCADASIPACPQ